MSGRRVLVCGGRDYGDADRVYGELVGMVNEIAVVIEGGAFGADRWARMWALDHDVELLEFPADWKRDGRAAGAIRNQRMLDEGKPDLVMAFPGGRGTADMVRRALKAGVEVREIQP